MRHQRLKLHDLRRHALTFAARMPGITTKELMKRGGHASPRAALIYPHTTEERERAIASFLDLEIAAAETSRRAGVGLQELAGSKSPESLEAATGIEPVYGALQAAIPAFAGVRGRTKVLVTALFTRWRTPTNLWSRGFLAGF